MKNWLKFGAAVVIGIAALWIIMAIVRLVVGLVMTLIYFALVITVLAVLIYGAYLLLSKVGGGSGGSEGKSRERIYE